MTELTLSSAQRILLKRIAEAAPEPFEIAPRARPSAAILSSHGLVQGSDDLWRITAAGLKALGLPAEPAQAPSLGAGPADPVTEGRPPREGSKAAEVISLLRRPGGATVVELSEATGWLPHSVRGFLAGALKKTHGLVAVSGVEDRGRVYRVPAGDDQ